MSEPKTIKDRFIEGVRIYMARNQVLHLQVMAPDLGLTYMALYKICNGPNNPTIDTCATLCRLAGYDANWLFLGEGKMEREEQGTLDKVLKELRQIKVSLK